MHLLKLLTVVTSNKACCARVTAVKKFLCSSVVEENQIKVQAEACRLRRAHIHPHMKRASEERSPSDLPVVNYHVLSPSLSFSDEQPALLWV